MEDTSYWLNQNKDSIQLKYLNSSHMLNWLNLILIKRIQEIQTHNHFPAEQDHHSHPSMVAGGGGRIIGSRSSFFFDILLLVSLRLVFGYSPAKSSHHRHPARVAGGGGFLSMVYMLLMANTSWT